MAYESKYGKDEDTQRMDYIHTEAHQMLYDLSLYLHEKVKGMPHHEKFVLQMEIRQTIDELLDELEEYEIARTVSHLYRADRLKRKLVRKIRTAHDLKYSTFNNRVYRYCSKELECIGGAIGGLIKSAQAEKKK